MNDNERYIIYCDHLYLGILIKDADKLYNLMKIPSFYWVVYFNECMFMFNDGENYRFLEENVNVNNKRRVIFLRPMMFYQLEKVHTVKIMKSSNTL